MDEGIRRDGEVGVDEGQPNEGIAQKKQKEAQSHQPLTAEPDKCEDQVDDEVGIVEHGHHRQGVHRVSQDDHGNHGHNHRQHAADNQVDDPADPYGVVQEQAQEVCRLRQGKAHHSGELGPFDCQHQEVIGAHGTEQGELGQLVGRLSLKEQKAEQASQDDGGKLCHGNGSSRRQVHQEPQKRLHRQESGGGEKKYGFISQHIFSLWSTTGSPFRFRRTEPPPGQSLQGRSAETRDRGRRDKWKTEWAGCKDSGG